MAAEYQYFYSSTERIHLIDPESIPTNTTDANPGSATVDTLCGDTYSSVTLNSSLTKTVAEVYPPEQLCGNCRRVAEAKTEE